MKDIVTGGTPMGKTLHFRCLFVKQNECHVWNKFSKELNQSKTETYTELMQFRYQNDVYCVSLSDDN